jgi:hypothetical protein
MDKSRWEVYLEEIGEMKKVKTVKGDMPKWDADIESWLKSDDFRRNPTYKSADDTDVDECLSGEIGEK